MFFFLRDLPDINALFGLAVSHRDGGISPPAQDASTPAFARVAKKAASPERALVVPERKPPPLDLKQLLKLQ